MASDWRSLQFLPVGTLHIKILENTGRKKKVSLVLEVRICHKWHRAGCTGFIWEVKRIGFKDCFLYHLQMVTLNTRDLRITATTGAWVQELALADLLWVKLSWEHHLGKPHPGAATRARNPDFQSGPSAVLSQDRVLISNSAHTYLTGSPRY